MKNSYIHLECCFFPRKRIANCLKLFRIILLMVLILFPSLIILSQDLVLDNQKFQQKNSISLEIGGYTVLGAVFYERVLINQPKFKAVGQIGYGVIGWPVGLHGLVSFKKHHFEFGTCVTIPSVIIDSGASNAYLTGRLGYRFQKPDGKFVFRAGLMPVVVGADKDVGPELILWVWPGFSFGWAF
jgi:hypothetical protein